MAKRLRAKGESILSIGASHLPYNSNPPTSGPHYLQPAPWGIYQHELPDEALVHNLEHGGIWISYNNIDPATKQAIETLAKQHADKMIVTPRARDDFDSLFTKDKQIIFAFHGYPWLIHRLTYRRANHKNLHVRGYKEEGTITTAFDMTVLNDIDRFHLVMDAVDRLPQMSIKAADLKQQLQDKLIEHKHYIRKHGEDMPEIRNWKWHGVTG